MTLEGERALIIGIATNRPIAWGCARAFRDLGAEAAVTYLNNGAEPHVRLLAAVHAAAEEMGEKGITVHAISPGPIMTRAASGIAGFDEPMDRAAERLPLHRLATIRDLGAHAAFPAGDDARRVTGRTYRINGGNSITG